MGYCVEIELRNVRFKVDKSKEVVKTLKELNEGWLKSRDWCRFNSNLSNVIDILDEIGFIAHETFDPSIESRVIHVGDFEREKLGDHQNMFEKLAPFLEDCEIAYFGEDDSDWKQVIKDGEVELVRREEF